MASPIQGPETKVEVRRMFVAPREKVFEAWTQREKLEKWMCRFPRNDTRYTASDARPGGVAVMDVKTPSGQRFMQTITYRDIEPPSKLVFTWDWQEFSAAGEKIERGPRYPGHRGISAARHFYRSDSDPRRIAHGRTACPTRTRLDRLLRRPHRNAETLAQKMFANADYGALLQ